MEWAALGAAATSMGAAASWTTAGVDLSTVLRRPVKKVKKILFARDIRGFETLENPLNLTLLVLKPEIKFRGILIHGPLGVGKTTIMQNLNNHEEVAKLFQRVIWLDVSSDNLDTIGEKKNLSIQELQLKVMHRLNLDTTIPAEHYREKIEERLKNKKYLLLLDNVKEPVNTDEIGFPNNCKQTGSKIVLTSRYKGVCNSIVDFDIEVELLTPEEAERMFHNIFEPKDSQSRKLMGLALKRCGCLPFAINIVAGYCKSIRHSKSWRTGVDNLTYFSIHGDDEITDMCKRLSFCYEGLDGTKLDCFCYSALYPEESDIYIDRLLDCWMAERFVLKDDKPDRASGKIILKYLSNRYLFQQDEIRKCVRMHKLIRIVALNKLRTDEKHKFLVLSNEKYLDQSNLDRWKGKRWISLADNNNLKNISDSPDCSELSTLFLQGNSKIESFPDLFFTKVGSLCVLDLMGTSITSLPDSLMEAKNLAVLYLNKCTNMLELPSVIGKLEFLEVLDISGSKVYNLPEHMQRLKHLKRFLVPGDAFRTEDTSDLISRLTTLQEMVIDIELEKKAYNWEIIDRVMGSVKSFAHLPSLQFRFLNDEVVDVIEEVDNVTVIYAHKEDNLKYFVEREDLDSRLFRVFIGCPISEDVNILNHEDFQRYVKYCNGNEQRPGSVLKLLPKADAVVIANHNNLENLSEFDFSKASAIRVEKCTRITCISDCHSIVSNLEQLCMSDLPMLEILWASICLDNLRKLKTLQLIRCPELRVIITLAAVQQGQPKFQHLEEIILVDMKILKSLCDNAILELPALKTLNISKCPEFIKNLLPDNAKNIIKYYN